MFFNYKTKFYNLFPELKVHCWGGLGSQLFAIALILDLQKRFPWRRFVLVFHTSGVTHRVPEITPNLPSLTFVFQNDYESYIQNSGSQGSVKVLFVRSIRFFLTCSGLVSSCNTDLEYKQISHWILSVRGHYSHRSLNKETVAKIRELMGLDSKPEILEGIAIHYRLGDLLSLGNKSFISSQTIVGAIHSQIPSIKNGEVNLFSDSIPAATEMLSELSDKFTIVPHDRNTVQSIKSLSAYEVFIGTNSKISLWVVLFRLNEKDTDKYTSLLPLSSRAEISRMIQNYGNLDSLNFY